MTESHPGDDAGPFPYSDDVVRAEYDWSSVAPSTAIVETVAIAADREPTDLETFQATVDADALNELLRSDGAESPERAVTVSLVFAGHDVVVGGDGTVAVRPTRTSDSK